MKDERLVSALDARLPDSAAKDRMWAAIEAAWEAEAEQTREEDTETTAPVVSEETAEETAAPAAAGFTVTAGGNAAKRKKHRYSWKMPTVAAVLVVALGAGALYFASGEYGRDVNPEPGPEIIDPDDTPFTPGQDDLDPGATDEIAVEWEGVRYVRMLETPLATDKVGESKGDAKLITKSSSGGEAEGQTVAVFAATGSYATGDYLVVQLDDGFYLFIRE